MEIMIIMIMMYQRLTQVVDIVAGLVQGSSIEFKSNDGEDDDRKEEEEGDVHLTMMTMMSMMSMMAMLTMMRISMIAVSLMTTITMI